MTRRRRWILLPLATLAAVLVVLVILFDWNWLKGLVEDQASAALGREVEIAGDLDVDMGLRPRITIEDARLANAPWASDAPMVAVARAEAVIDLPALLRGRLELPEVVVVGPAVRLETRPDGPPNWEMKPGEPSQRPPTIPQIGRLQLRDGSIAYRDHGSGRTIAATLAELSGSTVGGTAIAATGEVEGEPVTLEVKAAPVQGGEGPQVAYSIDARIDAGQTRITAFGGIDEPERLQGLHVEFDARSPDATELLRQLGIDVPGLPALQASGRLTREGEVWQLNDMQARIGESDLAGQVSADLSGSRPFLSADLQSNQLLVKDLIPTPETEEVAEEVAEEAAEEVPGLITASGVNFEALPKVDLDLRFQGDRVEAPEFAFDQLELDLKLRDGIAVADATADATFRQFKAVSFEAHAGTEDSLTNPDARYPLDLALRAGDTRASARGTVDRPLNYTGLDVDVALEGPDLQVLGEVLQLPLPATPPYDLAGKVTHEADEARWNLVAIRGTVGDSDLSGDVSLELGAERPTIVADLKSEKLDFDDLGVLVGAPPDTGPGETASPQQERQAAQETEDAQVLPDAKFRVPDLRAFDARISFTGESIQASKLPLERLALELALDDGVITAKPLRVGLAGGELEAVAQLDGREDVLGGELEVAVRQIRVNELLSQFGVEIAEIELEKEGVGTFNGRTALEVRGNSIHEMATSADGRLGIIMDGGQINALVVEAIGLDIGEAVALLLSGEAEPESEMVPVHCLVARFDIQDGIMRSEALVLETSDATITGKGQADLGEETLDLELLAHPKDASVLTASTPVRIEGTFKEPDIGLVSDELQEKSLAALALGVVLPVIGAVLPFIEQGDNEGPNCGRLIRDAQAAMPDAPAPDESK